MYIGNFMLLIFNLPLVGVFAKIIRIPLYLLMPLVLLLCLVGVYSINNSILDVWLMIGFGLLGYVMRRLDFDVAPLVLALVLGPMMERSFRETMMIGQGDLAVFLTRPISATILAVGAMVMVAPLLKKALSAAVFSPPIFRYGVKGVKDAVPFVPSTQKPLNHLFLFKNRFTQTMPPFTH